MTTITLLELTGRAADHQRPDRNRLSHVSQYYTAFTPGATGGGLLTMV
jgi:hypothetical protein